MISNEAHSLLEAGQDDEINLHKIEKNYHSMCDSYVGTTSSSICFFLIQGLICTFD